MATGAFVGQFKNYDNRSYLDRLHTGDLTYHEKMMRSGAAEPMEFSSPFFPTAWAGKLVSNILSRASTVTTTNFLKFGGDEAVQHFGRHADQIMKVTGKTTYNLRNYVDDANWIIQEGTYSPEFNGYYYFMGNAAKGESLMGFVGLKHGGTTISTFHIKTATRLKLK